MNPWDERVDAVSHAIEAWRARLLAPDEPEPGSSLHKDDLVYPALPCSQLAWWGLSVAVEHLDAAIRLLTAQTDGGGPYFTGATHTVIRGALLGASQAAALLLTPNREQRTTYALQLAHEELR